MKIETIETPRLALRGFTPEDAPFAISLWNDPVTGRWLSDPALEAIPDIEAYTKSVEGLGDSATTSPTPSSPTSSGRATAPRSWKG